ncbi:MAG: hypothetical protein J6W00_15410 [Lentisphaeria bacterium]|nr:hypothetical protein [Lentisphaeria bacterium]
MEDAAVAYEEKIKKLILAMNKDFEENDSFDDCPNKDLAINYIDNPWGANYWRVKCYAVDNGITSDSSTIEMVRLEPVDQKDFDESSMPRELIQLLKDEVVDGNMSKYPNVIEGYSTGETLEEAINNMRKKLQLFQYGYAFMDMTYYQEEYPAEKKRLELLDKLWAEKGEEND